MASPTGRRLHRDGFPHHEIVQRLAGFVGDKFDYGCVIDEAEDRRCVRNQVEWIDQVIEGSNDPQQCIVGDFDRTRRDGGHGPIATWFADMANIL